MTLREHVIYTAKRLSDLAIDMDDGGRDVPVRYIRALENHVAYLRAAAGQDSERRRPRRADGAIVEPPKSRGRIP